MKRKLSLLLAVVMILSSFSFVFADEDFNVPAFLEKNGILKGDTTGDLMLDQPLLRKDAVVLLARLLGKEAEAEAFEKEGLPTFNDLAGNPYYDAFLAWAEDNGYFIGKPDGSFGYQDNLEAVEYAIVLLRALGYEEEAAWDEAWAEAEKLGLLENVEAERREEILRAEVAEMTFNALSVTIKDSDQTLADFLGIDMPEEDELKVVDVYSENLAEVVVELSNAKLADKVQLENVKNYSLSGDLKVVAADVVGNDVILLLDIKNGDTFVRNREYTLTIKGIDKEINDSYKFVARDNTIPEVEKVEVLGEYGIKITTTEPVKDPEERNFLIDGRRESMEVEQYGRDIIITPYYNEKFDVDAEELEIRELVDFAGYKSAPVTFEIEVVKDEEGPKVVGATYSGNEVTVVFDKDIYKNSVAKASGRNLGNVSYEDGRRTFYAEDARKVDTNKVVYTFKYDWEEGTELTIQGVQNHSKVAMEETTVVPVELKGPGTDAAKLTNNDKRQVLRALDGVKGAVYEGELVLELKYDKEVDWDENETDYARYFTVYEKEVTNRGYRNAADDGVTITKVEKDGKKLLVSIKNLRVNDDRKNYDYILEIERLEDINGKKIARDYLDFEVVNVAETIFAIERITVDKSDNYLEFVIRFNEAVDREEARYTRNYLFTKDDGEVVDLEELEGEAIVEKNGKTVRLRIPVVREDQADFLKEHDKLEILQRVVNLDGDRLANENRVWNISDDGKVTNEAIENEKAAQNVIDLIKALPAVEDINAENLEDVREKAIEAREAYEALTEEQKELVPEEVLQKLQEAEAKIRDLEDPVEEATIEIEFNETIPGMGGGTFLVKSVSLPEGKPEPAKYRIEYVLNDGSEAETPITEIGTETGGFYKAGNEITIYIYDADENLIYTFENYVINM